MTNKRAIWLNFSFRINKYILLGMVFIITNLGCFGQVQKSISIENAREAILSERFNDAVVSYSVAAKNSDDPALISEYAYALALCGIYDAAMVQLDRLWLIGKESAEANYFISQVIALTGYDDLAGEWQKEGSKNKAPGWIASKQTTLLSKYKRQKTVFLSAREAIAAFNKANELAAQSDYFQALTLFRQIIDVCPQEFLPYVGYSITLEKTGALNQSIKALEKGLSLVPNDTEHKEMKQIFEQRTLSLSQKLKTVPAGASVRFKKPEVKADNGSQMMAFAGGMITSSYTSYNFKYGYFVSGKSNGSLDMGVTKTQGGSSSNMGFSFYNRQKIFVMGMGLMARFQQGASSFYYKVSAGLSFMNKKRSASYDIFLDGNRGFKSTDPTILSLSVGRSIYFGKRK